MPGPCEQYPMLPDVELPSSDEVQCGLPSPPHLLMVMVSTGEESGPVGEWKLWKDAIALWPEFADNAAALLAHAALGTPYRTPDGDLRIVVAPEE